MTKLNCSVVNCIYNEDNLCTKGDIMVEGKAATTKNDTSCSSFKEAKNGCGCNHAGNPKEEIKVDCHAVNCIFNEDCHCSADQIGIAGGEASDASGTECASFTCK